MSHQLRSLLVQFFLKYFLHWERDSSLTTPWTLHLTLFSCFRTRSLLKTHPPSWWITVPFPLRRDGMIPRTRKRCPLSETLESPYPNNTRMNLKPLYTSHKNSVPLVTSPKMLMSKHQRLLFYDWLISFSPHLVSDISMSVPTSPPTSCSEHWESYTLSRSFTLLF